MTETIDHWANRLAENGFEMTVVRGNANVIVYNRPGNLQTMFELQITDNKVKVKNLNR